MSSAPASPGPRPSPRALAIHWVVWATIGRVGRDALRIAGRLILARLLWPEAFGVYTLAVTVVGAFRVVCQLQFQSLVVQHPALTPTLLATAYWSQVALGGLGTLALLAVAVPLGALMGDARVAPVLQVLGCQLTLAGMSAVPTAWLLRQLAFRQLANRALLPETAGMAAAVGLALAGAGVWSLVIQDLVVETLLLLVVWRMVPWRPRRHWRAEECFELLRFGLPLVGTTGLQYLRDEGDRIVVGRGFGAAALGFYAVALRLVETASETLNTIFRQVAFPAFARTQGNPERIRKGFLEAVRFHGLVALPLLLSVSALAGSLVPLVLGPKWAAAIPLTEILAARALFASLLILPRAILLARGRQWLLLRLGLVGLAAFVLGWLIGFPWGPQGVATTGAAAAGIFALMTMRMAASELSIRVRDWCRALRPGAGAAAATAAGMGVGLWLFPQLLPAHPVMRLAALASLGGACYVVALAFFIGRPSRENLRLLRDSLAIDDRSDVSPRSGGGERADGR